MGRYTLRSPDQPFLVRCLLGAYEICASLKMAVVLIFILATALASGCDEKAKIEHYRVPKPEVLQRINGDAAVAQKARGPSAPAEPLRLLAAIVPIKDQGWFFRLDGPPDAVAAEVDNFTSLVKSLRFSGDPAKPQWTLPQGWQEEPGKEMRYATLRIAAGRIATGKQPLELSVVNLPRGNNSDAEYNLANINRWRGQLGLPPTTAADLAKQTTQIALDGVSATVVDLVGTRQVDGMTQPPFARGGPMGRPGASPVRPDASANDGVPTFDVPANWLPGESGGLRKAAFKIENGGKTAEVTLIDLEAVAADPLRNVNRWRQQLALPATTEAELIGDMKKIPLGDIQGAYIEIPGDKQSILAVMVPHGDKVWFFKLMGDTELVRQEKDHFESLVKSARFTGGKGTDHVN